MVTDDTQPLTKADGRHILELLANLMDRMDGMVTKNEFREEMDAMEKRFHHAMFEMEKRLLGHINFLDERNRKDYFDMLEIKYDQHDIRITRLEQHTGMTPR